MKEKIIKILNDHNKNMENYGYFGSNMGVSEDDFEEIADEIVELLKK